MKIIDSKLREHAIEYLKWYFEDDEDGADPEAVAAFESLSKPVKHIIKMDGKHCGNCDKWLRYDYKYCPYCGLKVG